MERCSPFHLMICGMTENEREDGNIIKYAPEFGRRAKELLKKNPNLKEDLKKFEIYIKQNPFAGDAYGNGIYKIRWENTAKNKGKRGGYRILYYDLEKIGQHVTLLMLTIFDKGQQSTIKKNEAVKLKNQSLKEIEATALKSGSKPSSK